MTEDQKTRIQELRKRGIGYRAIGEVLDIPRDAVRNYCKSVHLDGRVTASRVNVKKEIAAGIACQCCGQLLVQSPLGRKRRFCSEKCRREWWSKHQDLIKKSESAQYTGECAFCGRPFLAYGNNHRKYCSFECYTFARREQKGEKDEQRNHMCARPEGTGGSGGCTGQAHTPCCICPRFHL